MNHQIESALSELRAAGADKLPNPKTVATAKNGKIWSGRTTESKLWTLTKHDEDSYTVTS